MRTFPLIIEGGCWRVKIERGTPGKLCSSGILLELYVEDDGNWHKKVCTDALWITELQLLLEQALKFVGPLLEKYCQQEIKNES